MSKITFKDCISEITFKDYMIAGIIAVVILISGFMLVIISSWNILSDCDCPCANVPSQCCDYQYRNNNCSLAFDKEIQHLKDQCYMDSCNIQTE